MRDYAVLIPSKGRPKQLADLFKRCPMLNAPSTFVGLDDVHMFSDGIVDAPYDALFREGGVADKVRVIGIYNKDGYTSVAREKLRLIAVKLKYERYVLADDNCQFDNHGLRALLMAQTMTKGVVGGMHPTAPHFHADQIAETLEHHTFKISDREAFGLRTYEQVGMIFWCVPGAEYTKFRYPDDCYFDDVYFIMWLLAKGFTNFRCCMEAAFNKHLHQPGGTGNVASRIRKRGIGFARLATDFPQFMTTGILQTRVPYKQIVRAVKAGKTGV